MFIITSLPGLDFVSPFAYLQIIKSNILRKIIRFIAIDYFSR